MRTVFNAPPGWPVPEPGWVPAPDWRPDPAWPAPPVGWTFWLPAPLEVLTAVYRRRAAIALVAGAALTGLGAAAAFAASVVDDLAGDDAGMWAAATGLLVLGLLYLVVGALVGVSAPARAARLVARKEVVLVPLARSRARPSP